MIFHRVKKQQVSRFVSCMLLMSLLVTSVPLGEGIQAAEKQRMVVEKRGVIEKQQEIGEENPLEAVEKQEEIVEKELADSGRETAEASDEGAVLSMERDEKPVLQENLLMDRELASGADVIEVTDLGAFAEAVKEVSSKDDLAPAYEFQVDSATAVVDGEEQQISVPIQESGESYVVPEEVFAEDDAVNQEAITDGDGVVSLDVVAEISDYEVVEQENSVELVNPFQSKRLIVKSPEGFDPYGAVSIIQGYDQMFVLSYETEEATKAAYEYLQTIPYVSVETDALITTDTNSEEPVLSEDAGDTAESEAVQEQAPETGVTVAVIDTGYDIAGCGDARLVSGTDMSGEGSVQDSNGHGTAMANIILDHAGDTIKVMPVKAADKEGRSSSLKMYLALRYSMEHGADIINISMTAYKPNNAGIIKTTIDEAVSQGIPVVAAAGNYGEDTANYVPANVESALVVSAVKADKTLDTYSNHGVTVDYCANGVVEVRSMKNEPVTVSGTSVSAAIVSAVIGSIKAKDGDISYEELIGILDGQAEDLGDQGKDSFYGMGMLTLESIQAEEEKEEEKTETEVEVKVPELMSCDWKNLSDEALNELIMDANEIYQKWFLDDLSESDRAELLAREDILYKHEHTAVVYDPELNEMERFNGTLEEYLYSKFFDEYVVQEEYEKSKTYGIYNGNQPYWAASYECENKISVRTKVGSNYTTSAKISVEQAGGQPTNSYTVKISATNAGSFNFESMDICGRFLGGDDNGHNMGTTPYVYGTFINGIKVTKPAHSKITSQSSSKSPSNTHLVAGGFYRPNSETITDKLSGNTSTGYGSNACSSTSSTNVYLLVSEFDAKNNQVHTLNITNYGSTKDPDWSVGETTKEATCSAAGVLTRYKYTTCNGCKAVLATDTKTEAIEQRVHAYGSDWITATSNNVDAGVRYHQCQKTAAACGHGTDKNGEAWQKDFQYRQIVYYREQDVNGSFPGYSTAHDGYTALNSPFSWTASANNAFRDASASTASVSQANVYYVSRYRKQYTVKFDGNGDTSGSTASHTNVYVGKTFNLNKNGFVRIGYDFVGWSLKADGSGNIIKDEKQVSNLSTTDGETVTLYAVWEPSVFKITLDNQGADEGKGGEDKVYEKYSIGYYTDQNATQQLVDDKIEIPQKNVPANELIGGERKQLFLGYYTEKNGEGHKMIRRDGSLIANIADAGDYKYFTADATVYAAWEDMLAVQFDVNLTDQDMEILSHDANGNEIKDAVKGPETQWKEYGKDITINYETVEINNETFKSIYRLKGWSRTPEISSDEEIILSDEITSCTFSADEDVTLYAQWDTSFMVTYMGNEQTEGNDYLDKVEDVTDTYTFNPNDEEKVAVLQNDDADYFVKTVEKPTIDIATGDAVDESGAPYTETVPYSFLGWSMVKDQNKQITGKQYAMEKGEENSATIVKDAEETAQTEPGKGLTFSNPSADYGTSNAPHMSTRDLIAGSKGNQLNEITLADAVKGYLTQITGMPYVNMYAIWDEYPQIAASDLYFPLSYAQEGRITEEYLLNYATATDAELQSDTNPEGKMKNGEDTVNKTKFTVLDYQVSEFVGAESGMAMSITYRAEDSVGNVTEKMVMVYLVDTEATEYDPGYVRFISAEYVDTLSENSIWRTGDYATTLSEVLGNSKTGEEYTTVSSLQQALGAESVKKPGSGTWNQVEQVWEFTHEEVLAVHEYVESNGLFGSQDGFLSTFGHCRVQ